MKYKLDTKQDYINMIVTHPKQDHIEVLTIKQVGPLAIFPKFILQGQDRNWVLKGRDDGWRIVSVAHHGSSRNVKVARPPGTFLLSITGFFCFTKTQERVFIPIINDMRQEYFDALQEKKAWRAKWIRIIYQVSFIIAICQKPIFDLIKLAQNALKAD